MRRVAGAAAAGLAAIAASPWLPGSHGRVVTVTRSLMPWAGLTGLPLALVTARHGHRRSAAIGALTAAATAAMCVPLVRGRWRREPTTGPALSILHANLLYTNRHLDAVWPAIGPLDVDVVTFSEYTPHHARVLHAAASSAGYRHRLEIPARRAAGTALWSRYPITPRPTTDTTHHTVVADVHGPGGTPVRVVVVHTQSPLVHHGGWLDDLTKLAALHVEGPAVMTGDFNASWWHPELRAVLADGWRDAHVTAGRGLSSSWPTERWHTLFKWHPPFVRLDHALVTDDLDLVAVSDVAIPGSDHLGLVVRVAVPTPPAPP